MNDEAVERIESRISFLERATEELSDTIVRQQQEIGTLKAQLTALSARIAGWTSEATVYSPEQEKPPHY